jgi:hypothetical protein
VDIDQAKAQFEQIYAELSQGDIHIETEQDARFQVIDRILTDVLGWKRTEIKTEPRTDTGFVDYLITSEGRNILVVEAKRTSTLLVNTLKPGMAWYKVGGSALQSAADGLEQAKRYCCENGVLFSALTTGLQWIGFWAVRTDGIPPKEGKAVAFSNLESIQQNFAIFYDLFSREGVLANLYQIRVHEAEGLKVNPSELPKRIHQPPERIVNHDIKVFQKADELLSETKLVDLLDCLGDDESFTRKQRTNIDEFLRYFDQSSNQFICEELVGVTQELTTSVTKLRKFMQENFHIYPRNQENDNKWLCLQPNLNPDREGSYEDDNSQYKYRELQNELAYLCDRVSNAYKKYRLQIKRYLIV